MLDLTDVARVAIFEHCLGIVKGTVKMAWWRRDTEDDDKTFVESTNIINAALGDGDFVNRIEAQTGKNLREQLSVEEVEEMNKEANLRRWGNRRN